jgi:hypothetical protein
MSKIGDALIEIEELVEKGMSAKFIAAVLNVPLDWVYDVIEQRQGLEEMNCNGCIDEDY